MKRDGDGWVRCTLGHPHWGLYGAAGLMLVSGGRVLLQHRAFWSHHGNTWGIPGGARGRLETAEQAALREAHEEAGLRAVDVTVQREVVDDHGGWSYTTIVASSTTELDVEPLDGESTALEWVPLRAVAERPLHPGFAAGWLDHLQALNAG